MDRDAPAPALDFIAEWMDLPEGALPESGVVILSYLDRDGKSLYTARELGHGDKTELLGTMSLVMHALMHSIMPDTEEDTG